MLNKSSRDWKIFVAEFDITADHRVQSDRYFHATGLCVKYHPKNARMGPRIAVDPA